MTAGCGDNQAEPTKKEEVAESTSYFRAAPVEVPEAHRNQLAREPSDFLRSRATDPIHWQPWSRELLQNAKSEQKLVFTIVGNGRYPECARLLDALRQKPALIESLHADYICALVDPDVHPEMAIRVAVLSSEIRRRIAFPAMIWASHEGNPVAWLPLSPGDVDDIDEVFGNSNAMVTRIWRDSSKYVIQNSRRDNDARMERQRPVLADAADAEILKDAVDDALRRLSSLHDRGTGVIDGGGGLVPSALWRLAGTAALSPRTNPEVARRLHDMLDGNTDLLLRSAIRDPLDGAFFSARRSSGWDLPVFMKTVDTQSQMAVGLLRASALLDSPAKLEVAREALEFAKQHFGSDGDGLGTYESASAQVTEPLGYLWSHDGLKELLTPEEFAVATAAFHISGMGNIPPESDPKRDFFRKNSLGAKASIDEIAATLGKEAPDVAALLDAVCRRLLAQREEIQGRGNVPFMETGRVTATNARYANATAQFAALSGDSEWLRRSQALLQYMEAAHRAKDGALLRFPGLGNRRPIPARAEDYAALMEAHLEVYRADLDPAHLAGALDLLRALLANHLSRDGFITEAPKSQLVGEMPTYSDRMIFGESTWGTLYGPLTRLHQLTGDSAIEEVADKILRVNLSRLGVSSPTNDLLHTDFLNNAQIRLGDTVVYLRGVPGTPEFDALHAVLKDPRFWAVTPVHLGAGLPEAISSPVAPTGQTPTAHVRTGRQAPQTTTDAPGLERLLQEALAPK